MPDCTVHYGENQGFNHPLTGWDIRRLEDSELARKNRQIESLTLDLGRVQHRYNELRNDLRSLHKAIDQHH